MPAVRDPERRPPTAAIVAAILALPAAYVLLALGSAALAIAGGAHDGGGATWLVLLITFGWIAGLLVGAVRLLLGRAWISLAVSAALLTVLLTVGVVMGGLGGASWFSVFAWAVSACTAVCASLPAVRRWVSARRRERLYPGSAQPTPSRS